MNILNLMELIVNNGKLMEIEQTKLTTNSFKNLSEVIKSAMNTCRYINEIEKAIKSFNSQKEEKENE